MYTFIPFFIYFLIFLEPLSLLLLDFKQYFVAKILVPM